MKYQTLLSGKNKKFFFFFFSQELRGIHCMQIVSLGRRQFAWNVKTCFLEKKEKHYENTPIQIHCI